MRKSKQTSRKSKVSPSDSRPSSVSIAEAKARFSELVSRAAAGETVSITRRGRPIAKLAAVEPAKKPIDIAMLRAVTDRMTMQDVDAGTFVRQMRDEDRY